MSSENSLLDKLMIERSLPVSAYEALLSHMTREFHLTGSSALALRAAETARQITARQFKNQVYVRGLIELTNVCSNDCYYCGIRKSKSIHRYRLTKNEILNACEVGWLLGYRTFVLQGGEDPWWRADRVTDLIAAIRRQYPAAAITLSLGEHERVTYEQWFSAGANRYLLRHETADAGHYACLHPSEMSLARRMQCLSDLKAIGYQVGCGFMVGSPGQTNAHLAKDLKFIEGFDPAMVGIGPFLPAGGTPFSEEKSGSLELTLFLLSLLRIQKPERLIPATTAVGSLHPLGREMALDAGANVLMPNISPTEVRKDYALYDGKICMEDKAADCRQCLTRRVAARGYQLSPARGDYIPEERLTEDAIHGRL